MHFLYSALWWMALPFVLFRLWRRGRNEPGYRQHIGERLGFYKQIMQDPTSSVIWVHAVSVGETRAAQPLVEALLQAYPRHAVLLTHTTATGRVAGRQLFARHGARVIQSFFPYDLGWVCGRFLRYFKPKISILMETEVWPNMLRQCTRHHLPVILVNARLSERSMRRGKRFRSLLRDAADRIACVAAQTDDDANRLRSVGAHNVHVTGNLKFDVRVPDAMVALGEHWRTTFGSRPVLLCASTREGEEELLLDALSKVNRGDLLTIIVPRHPQRFDDVAGMIVRRGFAMQRRSFITNTSLDKDTSVILGDSMGEMFAYYAACNVAFIGGSLLPFGGQNLIEACALGKPVLIGPHTFNFQAICEQAIAAGNALRLNNASEVVHSAQFLLEEQDLRMEMASRASTFFQQHQGATLRTMSLIENFLF